MPADSVSRADTDVEINAYSLERNSKPILIPYLVTLWQKIVSGGKKLVLAIAPPVANGKEHTNSVSQPVELSNVTAQTEVRTYQQQLLEILAYKRKSDIYSVIEYEAWYRRWLAKKVEQSFTENGPLKELISDLGSGIGIIGVPARTYQILSRIAGSLSMSRNLSIDDIHHEIYGETVPHEDSDKAQQSYQALFIGLGLVSLLFEPDSRPPQGLFQLGLRSDGRAIRNETWRVNQCSLSQGAESISSLLRSFSGAQGCIPRHTPSASVDSISAPNVCFYTLTKLAEIEIVWVDEMCSHLEFDWRRKKLKVFRFPSFCALVAVGNMDTCYLSRLFEDYFSAYHTEPRSAPTSAGDFCRELICTYRLIFGQHKSSYKAFRSIYGPHLSTSQTYAAWDPLLNQLCGHAWEKQPIYEDINAPGIRTVYSADRDFGFFGDRLLTLHEFVTTQSADDWRALWRDRRDMSRFWALWLVLLFGGLTVVIGIIQIGLAGAQVAGTFPK